MCFCRSWLVIASFRLSLNSVAVGVGEERRSFRFWGRDIFFLQGESFYQEIFCFPKKREFFGRSVLQNSSSYESWINHFANLFLSRLSVIEIVYFWNIRSQIVSLIAKKWLKWILLMQYIIKIPRPVRENPNENRSAGLSPANHSSSAQYQ